jgi:hypothetical protein
VLEGWKPSASDICGAHRRLLYAYFCLPTPGSLLDRIGWAKTKAVHWNMRRARFFHTAKRTGPDRGASATRGRGVPRPSTQRATTASLHERATPWTTNGRRALLLLRRRLSPPEHPLWLWLCRRRSPAPLNVLQKNSKFTRTETFIDKTQAVVDSLSMRI